MKNDNIIIAGAGPVGMVAALKLAKNGIKVTVLEAGKVFPKDLRASTFHPPTLEMLDELGLTDELIADGLVAPYWQLVTICLSILNFLYLCCCRLVIIMKTTLFLVFYFLDSFDNNYCFNITSFASSI